MVARQIDSEHQPGRQRCAFSLLPVILSILVSTASMAWVEAVTVRVLDESGTPVRDARASTWQQEEAVATLADRQTVDNDGSATLSFPGKGPIVLSVSAPGYLREIRILKDDPHEALTVTLRRGRSMRLSVTDAGSGLPVSRFSAIALPADSNGTSPERLAFIADGLDSLSFSSPEGTGVLTGLGDEPVILVVRAKGYAPAVVPRVVAREQKPISVRLDSSGCIQRRIVDGSTGVPLEGARAAASPEILQGPLSRIAVSFVSDEDGYMTICPLMHVDRPLLVVHDGYAPAWIPTARTSSDGTPDEVFALRAGGTIRGTIMGSDGLPLARAVVETHTLGLPRKTETGENGSFQLDRLAPGMVDLLVAEGPSSTGAPLARQTVEVAEGETTEVLIETAQPREVRVLRRDLPVKDATVVLLERKAKEQLELVSSGRTDRDGKARLQGASILQPGEILGIREGESVVFVPVPERKPDEEEGEPVVVRLEGLRCRGSVVDGSDERPIAGAQVRCSRGATVRLSPERSPLWFSNIGFQVVADKKASLAFTDSRGRFALSLPPWCESVHVQGPRATDDGIPWESRFLSASEFSPSDPIVIRLERGSSIRARVSLGGSVWNGPGRVSLRRPDSRGDSVSATLTQGEGTLAPRDRGPWLVLAKVPGMAPAVEGPLYTQRGQLTKVNLELTEGAFLRIVGSRALVSAREQIRVVDSARRDWQTLTETTVLPADAGIRIGPLPVGRYRLHFGEKSTRAELKRAGDEVVVDWSEF